MLNTQVLQVSDSHTRYLLNVYVIWLASERSSSNWVSMLFKRSCVTTPTIPCLHFRQRAMSLPVRKLRLDAPSGLWVARWTGVSVRGGGLASLGGSPRGDSHRGTQMRRGGRTQGPGGWLTECSTLRCCTGAG